jgi:hypothetical protein
MRGPEAAEPDGTGNGTATHAAHPPQRVRFSRLPVRGPRGRPDAEPWQRPRDVVRCRGAVGPRQSAAAAAGASMAAR